MRLQRFDTIQVFGIGERGDGKQEKGNLERTPRPIFSNIEIGQFGFFTTPPTECVDATNTLKRHRAVREPERLQGGIVFFQRLDAFIQPLSNRFTAGHRIRRCRLASGKLHWNPRFLLSNPCRIVRRQNFQGGNQLATR